MSEWCGLGDRKPVPSRRRSGFQNATDSVFNLDFVTCCGESDPSKGAGGAASGAPVPSSQPGESKAVILTRKDILYQIEEEVTRLFDRFDADGSGQIDGTRELKLMVAELRAKGFTFGKRIEDFGPQDSIASSRYAPILSRTIQVDIMKTYDDDGSGSLGKREFHDWFHKEVISRKSNLRLLLHQNDWLMSVIDRIFLECDKDGGGTVAPDELEKPLRDIAFALGEPPPSTDEINALINKADCSGDGELSPIEFRFVMVEVATKLFYGHFNFSMHPQNALD